MHVQDAQLVISAASEKQYPETDQPEVVLLGRSNVGKSSFINTLINRKGLARTSSQPGKTQTMNFYDIGAGDTEFSFVDMPGYGYARASKKDREKWGKMIETYLQKRKNIVLVMLLVDSRIGPTEDDMLMYDWLSYYGKTPIVIATKSDKLSGNARRKVVKEIAEDFDIQNDNQIILFSSSDRTGKDEAWKAIEQHL
ncbi:MAG: ribosome biogenesis GTP-binding protein YihA/YsxC [Eubacteriaceae bacterium]|jgi:GTP-binding protein